MAEKIDCTNDAFMVKNNLRVAPVNIDKKVFIKTENDRVVLANVISEYKKAKKDRKTFSEQRQAWIDMFMDSHHPQFGSLIFNSYRIT